MRVQAKRIKKALQSLTNEPLRLSTKGLVSALGAYGSAMAGLRASRRSIPPWSIILGGAVIGAGLMYYLDPTYGRRRRALVHDKLVRSRHIAQQGALATRNDFRHRARGLWAELRSSANREQPADEVLEARIRSKLGYACSHPHAVHVKVENGHAWLSGRILEPEIGRVLRAADRVRGVASVRSDLEVHNEPGAVPDLQGGAIRRGRRFELFQDNWSPSARFAAGCAGLMLVSYGIGSRKPLSPLSVLSGAAILARSITNMPTRSLFGLSEARGIEIVKTVHIKAPIDEVFRYWQEPENLPKFMEHVKAVRRLDDGTVVWELKGPLDMSVNAETNLVTSESERVVAWQSTARSPIGLNGIIRFQEEDGGTRLHLRMTYSPPAGAVGHAFAKIFRADPKRDLDDDMVRFKSLIEHGKATVHGRTVSRDELSAL